MTDAPAEGDFALVSARPKRVRGKGKRRRDLGPLSPYELSFLLETLRFAEEWLFIFGEKRAPQVMHDLQNKAEQAWLGVTKPPGMTCEQGPYNRSVVYRRRNVNV